MADSGVDFMIPSYRWLALVYWQVLTSFFRHISSSGERQLNAFEGKCRIWLLPFTVPIAVILQLQGESK